MRVLGRGIFFFVAMLLGLCGGAKADGGRLSPGLTEPRPGLFAYGDLWHWCFWHEGLHAGQMSSHDEHDYNIDLMHFHGCYRGGVVLARIDGPGVVYRIWSAGPSGTIFFWADEEDSPAIKCKFKDLLLGESVSEKAFSVGRYANYTPYPFERSLVITTRWYKLEGAYYQVSYTTFDQGHGLPTMTMNGARDHPQALASAKKFWESAGKKPARDPGGIPREVTEVMELAPADSQKIEIPGAGLVTELEVVDPDHPLDTLADLCLRIYWDKGNDPAVDSPVDAFFGNRYDSRRKGGGGPYETIAASATGEGYSCRWPMPFGRGMRLVLTNRGETGHRVKVAIRYRALSRLPENTMRFHALYREQDYPDRLTRDKVHGLFHRVDQSKNYVVLQRRARGYYVGCFLYVASLGRDWWGEGDEMIWVDGDPTALIRGTGTEDEFNWSFGFRENRSPISGALRVASRRRGIPPTQYGYSMLYRYRLGDFVPFREYIKVTYERLGSTSKWMKRYPGSQVNVSSHRGDDYRSVAFWYELP